MVAHDRELAAPVCPPSDRPHFNSLLDWSHFEAAADFAKKIARPCDSVLANPQCMATRPGAPQGSTAPKLGGGNPPARDAAIQTARIAGMGQCGAGAYEVSIASAA
jgi:hypothetical protein